jgi:hypothetical protein
MGGDILSELLRANDAFYGVFAAGDIEGMDALWAVRAPVACIHPGWPALHGREQVMSSWREILLDAEAPKIRCEQPHAFAVGDAGIVTCIWHLVHHQAGPLQPAEVGFDPGQTIN